MKSNVVHAIAFINIATFLVTPVILVGCSTSTTSVKARPKSSDARPSNIDMREFVHSTEGLFDATEAHKATVAFLAASPRGWIVKGMASHIVDGNLIIIRADAVKGGQSRVFDVAVERFYPLPIDAAPYWVCTPITHAVGIIGANEAFASKQDASDSSESTPDVYNPALNDERVSD